MYRCSVELSVQYDGQSQSESEHASLIDEHNSFNSVAKQIRFVFEHWIRLYDKHARSVLFGNTADSTFSLITGFALVV